MMARKEGNARRGPGRNATTPKTEDATDIRVRRSKALVLRTTTKLLIAKGVAGISVDDVARRSGVAKTTIYRHWPTRSALIVDACASLSTAQSTPDSGSFEGDVAILLHDLAHLLTNAAWPSVLPSIVDAAERDEEMAGVYARIQLGHAAPYLRAIERGKRRGEVDREIDASSMVAELVGPLFYRRWFSREALDKAFVRSVVQKVVAKAGRP